MSEKEKILEYVKMLMKEFNAIILLMLIAMLLTYFTHPIFTVLFIASLGLLAYKITKVNAFINKLEDILKEDIKISDKEDDLMKCHKKLMKTEHKEYIDDTKIVKDEQIEEEKSLTEEPKEEVIEEVIEETEVSKNTIEKEDVDETEEVTKEVATDELETITHKNYVNDFDYIDELDSQEETIKEVEKIETEPIEEEKEITEEVKEDIKEEVDNTKEDIVEDVVSEDTKEELSIDIKKCIRKLPKGRKASEKAKALALSYGYELKEGETFVAPKK